MLNVQLFDAYGTVSIKGLDAVEARIKKLQDQLKAIPSKVQIQFSATGGIPGGGGGSGAGGGAPGTAQPPPSATGRPTTGAGVPGYRSRGVAPSLAVDRYADPVDRLERDLRRAYMTQVKRDWQEKQRLQRETMRVERETARQAVQAGRASSTSAANVRRQQAVFAANAQAAAYQASGFTGSIPRSASHAAAIAAAADNIAPGATAAMEARVLAAGSPAARQKAQREAYFQAQKAAIEERYKLRTAGLGRLNRGGLTLHDLDKRQAADSQRHAEYANLYAARSRPYKSASHIIDDPETYKIAVGEKAAAEHAQRVMLADRNHEAAQAQSRAKILAEAEAIRKSQREHINKVRDEYGQIARSPASDDAKAAARVEARRSIDASKETHRAMMDDLKRRAEEEKSLHSIQRREAIQTSKVLQAEAKAAAAVEIKEAKSASEAVRKSAEKQARASQARSQALSSAGRGVSMGMGLPMLGGDPMSMATFGLTRGVGAVIGQSVGMEHSMADIRAVLGTSPEQSQELRKALFGVARKIAGTTTDEAASMAAELVRADNTMTNPQDIAKATEFMALMKNALPTLDPHDMVRKSLKISHAYQMAPEHMLGMGSAIVAMDQSSVGSAQDILDFTSRLGGSAKTLGVTLPEVVALAATAKDVGINNETGASSIAQVWQRMGANSDLFGEKLGIGGDAFRRMFNRSPVQALSAYLQKGAALTDNTARMEYFAGSGFKGYRVSDTVGKLTTGIQTSYAKNLALAESEMNNPTVLLKRQAIMGDTVQSRMVQVQNAFQEIAVEIGDSLLPILKDFAEGVLIATQSLAKWLGLDKTKAGGANQQERLLNLEGRQNALDRYRHLKSKGFDTFDLERQLGVGSFAPGGEYYNAGRTDAERLAIQKDIEERIALRKPGTAFDPLHVAAPANAMQAWRPENAAPPLPPVVPPPAPEAGPALRFRLRMRGRFAEEPTRSQKKGPAPAPLTAEQRLAAKRFEDENARHADRLRAIEDMRGRVTSRRRRSNESREQYAAAMERAARDNDQKMSIENRRHGSAIENLKLREQAKVEAQANRAAAGRRRSLLEGMPLQGYDSKILGGSQLSHTIQTDILNAARAKKEQQLIDALTKNATATQQLAEQLKAAAPGVDWQAVMSVLG